MAMTSSFGEALSSRPRVSKAYFMFSPKFWAFGTPLRVLAGKKTANAALRFMWIVHVLGAAYTMILMGRPSLSGYIFLKREEKKANCDMY